MGKQKLILIDGNGYVHRAYHAIPKLTDSRGNVVNAVFGFMKMLRKVINQEKPSHIFVAFDDKKPTFRHESYKEYKANREKTDPELIEQFPILFNILETLNIQHMSCEGYEADDIIATLTNMACKKDVSVEIVTSDKDLYQLVDSNVSVLDGMKGKRYDEKEVEAKLGIVPDQVIDYLALVGDSSDNLPGVKGVGPVTAQKLLKEYNDLDGIYKNIGKVKAAVSDKLIKYKEDAYTTRELVSLKKEVSIAVTIEDCLWNGPDQENLKKQLDELNFRSIIQDWISNENIADNVEKSIGKEVKIKVIKNKVELEKFVQGNFPKDKVVIEIITGSDSVNLPGNNPTGVGIAFDLENVAYIPVKHSYLGVSKQISWEDVLTICKKYILENKVTLIAYDFKRAYKFFRKNDIEIKEKYIDIITAAYLLDPEISGKGFRDICAKYLGNAPVEIMDEPAENEIEKVAGDVSGRLVAVLKLYGILAKKIEELGLVNLFYNIELPVLKILAEMELAGISVDIEEIKSASIDFKKRSAVIEEDIVRIAGEKFNINSSKQLAVILFDKIGLKPVRKTKTGSSTAEDVLHRLSSEHPLPGKILEYRKLHKLLSTYIEPLPAMVNKETRRLHTTFNITGTVTGRLSSSEPNLQNIPVRTSEGCIIRKTFIPAPGKIFLSADYSQIDLRVLAHISGDKNLIESFRSAEDIHKRTASKVFDVEESEVTPEMRKKAKTINFGIVYGMSSTGLSKKAGMSRDEAKTFIEKYFNEYPGINDYISKTIDKVKKEKFVTTIFNRRRYFREINTSNPMQRRLFERMAVNTPIQGSSADIIKAAMVDLNREYDFNNGSVKLLLQIHDELLFEISKEKLDSVKDKIKELMEDTVKLSVPVVVDIKKGFNWRDLEKC